MAVIVDAADAKRWTDVLTAILGGKTLVAEDFANIESLWDLVEAILLATTVKRLELVIRADKRRNFSWRNGTITKALKKRLGVNAEFPQGAKILEIADDAEILLSFLRNLGNNGYVLYKMGSGRELKAKPIDALADHFDLDLDALEAERKDALARVRLANSETNSTEKETIH